MTSVCMQALHGMFIAKPKASYLPASLNAQLINALYDYQPGENDVQPMQAWLAVMEAAHTNLARYATQMQFQFNYDVNSIRF